MRRFKFTLESVLTVREKALENARIQLASITNIYNKQLDVLKEMQIALENISQEAQNYMFDGNFNPSLIANYTAFSNKIAFDIKTQEQIIEKTKIDLTYCNIIRCRSIIFRFFESENWNIYLYNSKIRKI